MEKASQLPIPGSRQSNLKKSFKLGIRSLLTTCSKEEISKAFARFSNAEQEALHRLFIQDNRVHEAIACRVWGGSDVRHLISVCKETVSMVITSLHENIEDEFESVCLETQAGNVLDTVEQLVEEQNLDSLFFDKTDVGDVWRDVSIAKKNEIQHLTSVLKLAEEHECIARARVEQLKNDMQDLSGTADVIEKLRTGILNYGTSNNS